MDDLSMNPYQSTTESVSSKCERSPYAILAHFHPSTGFAKMVSSFMSYFLRTRGRSSLTLNPEGVICKRDSTPLSDRCVTYNNCLTDNECTHAEGAEDESEIRTVEVKSPHGKKDETVLHQECENRFSRPPDSLSFDSSDKLSRRQLINQKLCEMKGSTSRQRTEAFSAPCLPRKHNNFLHLEQKPDIRSFGSDCGMDSAFSNSGPNMSKGEIYELCSDNPHVKTSFCATPKLRTGLIFDSMSGQRKKDSITTIDRIGRNTRLESEAKYYAQPHSYSINFPLKSMTTNDYQARKHYPQTSRMVFPDMFSRNDTYDSGFLSQKLDETNSTETEMFEAPEVKRSQLAPVQNSTEKSMRQRKTNEGMSRNVPTPYNVTAFSYEPTDGLSVNCNQPIVIRTGPDRYKIRRDTSTLAFEERFPSVGDDVLPWDMPCNQLPSLAAMATEQMVFHSSIQPINIGVQTARSDPCIIHTKADTGPSHDASRQIRDLSPVTSAFPLVRNQPKIHYSPHPAKVVATDIFLGKASPMAPSRANMFDSFHDAKSDKRTGDKGINSGNRPTRPLAKRRPSPSNFYVSPLVQSDTGLAEETKVTSGHKYTKTNHCEIKTSKNMDLNEKEPMHNLKTYTSGSNTVLKESLPFNRQTCPPRCRILRPILGATKSEAKDCMSEYNDDSEHILSKELFESYTQSSQIICESGAWESCQISDAIEIRKPKDRTANEAFCQKNGSLSSIHHENKSVCENNITERTTSPSNQSDNSQEGGVHRVRNQNISRSPPINSSNAASEGDVTENIVPGSNQGTYSEEDSINLTGPLDENALLTVTDRRSRTMGSKSSFEEETGNASWHMIASADTQAKKNPHESDITIENTTATVTSESLTETQHDLSCITNGEYSQDLAPSQEESDNSHDSESEVSSALSIDSRSGQDSSTGSALNDEIKPISLHHKENSCDIATLLTPSTLHVVYGYPTPSLLEKWIDSSPRRFRRNYDHQDERYQGNRMIPRIHFSPNIENDFADTCSKGIEPKTTFRTSDEDNHIDEKNGMDVDVWNSVKEKKKIAHGYDNDDAESDEYQDAVSVSTIRGQSRDNLHSTMTEGTRNISKTNFSSSTMLCASSSESNYKTVNTITQNLNEELGNSHKQLSNARDEGATFSIASYNHKTYTVDPKNNPFQFNRWSEKLKELNKADNKNISKSHDERSRSRVKRRSVSDIQTNAEDVAFSMASFDNKTYCGGKNGASLKKSNSCGINEKLVAVEGMVKTHSSVRGKSEIRAEKKFKDGSRERSKIKFAKDRDEHSLYPRVRCSHGDFEQIGTEYHRQQSEDDLELGSSLQLNMQSLMKMQKKLSNKKERKTRYQKHCREKDEVISDTMSFINDGTQDRNPCTFLSTRCEDVNEHHIPEEGSNCRALQGFGKMNEKEKNQAHEATSNIKQSASKSWGTDQISNMQTRWKERFASEKKMSSHGDRHENTFGYFVEDLKGTSDKERGTNYSNQTPAFHSVSQVPEKKLLVDTSDHRLLVSNAHSSKSPFRSKYYMGKRPVAKVGFIAKHPKLNYSEGEMGNDFTSPTSSVPENELFYDVKDH